MSEDLWKLVPVEPTNEMKFAGGMIPDVFQGTIAARGNADRVYKAMIAAAPENHGLAKLDAILNTKPANHEEGRRLAWLKERLGV